MAILSKSVPVSTINNEDLYWQLVDAGVKRDAAQHISSHVDACVSRLLKYRRRARNSWKCGSNDAVEQRKSFSRWFQQLRRTVVLWATKNVRPHVGEPKADGVVQKQQNGNVVVKENSEIGKVSLKVHKKNVR